VTLDFSIFFYTAVVRDTRCGHNDNRCDADAPLSSNLRLPRHVRPFTSSHIPAQYGLCRFRMHESPQVSNLAFAKTKQTDATSTVPDRVEVTMDKAFGQHPTGSTSGDSTTIFSTSEQMPHIVCESSKLSMAPESTWPLPAVSSSHGILQAQSV
jgi:hypothetical protein